MENLEIYSELGLTKYESLAYSILIEFGKLSAAEISAKSGVPYGKIYPVLASLVNKSLAKIIPEKTKKFSPTDPEALNKLIEEKERRLKKAKEEGKDIVEVLRNVYARSGYKNIVEPVVKSLNANYW